MSILHASATSKRALVANIISQIYHLQYYAIASVTILYFDHIITFPTEVEKIWKRRMSFSSIIFLINRYVTAFGYMFIIYLDFNPVVDTTFCVRAVRFGGILSLITQIIISIVLSLRTYAVYNKSPWVLIPLTILGISTIVASAWSLTQFKGIVTNFGGGFGGVFRVCIPAHIVSDIPYKINIYLSIAFDTIVSLLTISRTFSMIRKAESNAQHTLLPRLLIRDGSLYFTVMVLANVINLILFYETNNTFLEQSTGNNAIFTHIISVTIISRLILNLHSFNDRSAARSGASRARSVSGRTAQTRAAQLTTCVSREAHVSRYSAWMTRTAEEFSFHTNTSDTITDPSIDISHTTSDDSYFRDDDGLDDGIDFEDGVEPEREDEHEMQAKETRKHEDIEELPRWSTDIGYAPEPRREEL